MKHKFILIWLCLLFSSCSDLDVQGGPIPVPSDAKIGVIFIIDKNPRYVYVGTTIFNKGRNELFDSDWDMQNILYSYAKQKITSGTTFRVENIQPTEKLITEINNDGKNNAVESFLTELKSIKNENHLDFILLIASRNYFIYPNSTIYAKGYGLWTRCFLGLCGSGVLDGVSVEIYGGEDVKRIATGLPPWSWGAGYHAPPPISGMFGIDTYSAPPDKQKELFDSAKEPSIKLLEENIDDALGKSNLLNNQSNNQQLNNQHQTEFGNKH